MSKSKYGLRELPKDNRDFPLGAFTVLPELSELPDEFEHTTPFPIKNQGDTDYCSAYSSCGASELQEDVELYPEYSFALSKDISGNIEEWGQDLRSACKAHLKGAIPMPPEPQNGDLRDLYSYPPAWLHLAKKHAKKSYFKITGNIGDDSFDAIKKSIWKYREEKRGIMIGVIWSWRVSDYILNAPQASGFGHAIYIAGWDNDGLIAVNSYGESAGHNGKHRVTREVINAFVPRYGAYMFLDYDPEHVKTLLTRREWHFAGYFKKLWILIRGLWN